MIGIKRRSGTLRQAEICHWSRLYSLVNFERSSSDTGYRSIPVTGEPNFSSKRSLYFYGPERNN